MNLTISKEQIINGLQAVQNVVSTRTTLPILSNVLLRAEEGRLELTATDLDVTIVLRRRGEDQQAWLDHRAGEKAVWHREGIGRRRY